MLHYAVVVGPSQYSVCAFTASMTPSASSSATSTASSTDTVPVDKESDKTDTRTMLTDSHSAIVKRMVVSPGIDLTLVDTAANNAPCPFTCPFCRRDNSNRGSSHSHSHNNSSVSMSQMSGGRRCSIDLTEKGDGAGAVATGRCCKGYLVVGFVGRLSLALRLNIRHRVQFLGQLTHPSISAAFAAMDVLVTASSNRMETFSVVNIEAMAAAVPVVSFGTYGQGENLTPPDTPVEYANSIIVLETTVDAVTHAVQRLVVNGTLRHVLGCNGRRLVAQRFTIDDMDNIRQQTKGIPMGTNAGPEI
eukprot:gene10408-21705_t